MPEEEPSGEMGEVELDEYPLFYRDEPAQPEPLALGSVVGERYAIAEVLAVQANRVHYRALDLVRCPACGGEESAPDDAFCATCGADRTRKASREIVAVHGGTEEDTIAELEQPVEGRWKEDGQLYLVLASGERVAAAPEPSLRFVVGQRTDPGLVRELDEDSLLAITMNLQCEACDSPAVGLFAVADGMGGHSGGEVASRIALQVLGREVLQRLLVGDLMRQRAEPSGDMLPAWDEEDALGHLREAVMVANDQVYLERHRRDNDMGTTVTAALVRGDRLLIAHVGDCRAYLWGTDGLVQLTTDHSIVASLAQAGQIEPDAIYTHPQRSVIYRCIGDQAQIEVDTLTASIDPGERLLLCCDGLWEMLRPEGIEEVLLREADPQVACDQLVRYANQAGGEDNISVIVVQLEAV
jgi:serine/threonine protein phosphatase PrpC